MAYLRIGFADYELIPVPAGDKNLLLGNHVCMGLVDHEQHTLYYRNDFDGQVQLQTIAHECLHVADWQEGDCRQGEEKERDIDRYANFIVQFIRDNRDYVKTIWNISDKRIVVKKKATKGKGK